MRSIDCIARGASASAQCMTIPITPEHKPIGPAPETRPRIMVLHPVDEHLVELLAILSRCHYRVEWSTDLADAMTLLGSSSVPLVICESSLTDGTWKDLMRHVSVWQTPPLIIVTARHANDELWVDVLNRGGYDVLVEPFQANEVARVVSVALAWWHEAMQ